MIKRFILILLIVTPFLSVAQATKTYLTLDGRPTANSLIAASYVIVQKLDEDSAYLAKQYNLHDTLLSVGYFKDDHLSIPNGKFTYYSRIRVTNNGRDSMVNYIFTVGYYINGEKTGDWVEYVSPGIKKSVNKYEYGHLNGPYTIYYPDGGWVTGTMVNDVNVGSIFRYRTDSLLVQEMKFNDGKLTQDIEHLKGAEPKYNFYDYMEKKLKAYKAKLQNSWPIVAFSITKDGTIIDPKVTKGINAEIDSAIVAALKTAPPFSPAKYDGVSTNDYIVRSVFLFRNLNANNHPFHDSFKFIPSQRIDNGAYSAMAPRSDGSVIIETRVPLDTN